MEYLKVEVFTPESSVKDIIRGLNEKDLLRDGPYDSVYSETKVTGHWRPLEGAHPADGEIGKLSSSPEIKLEFRIDKNERDRAERIIREIHPYEVAVVNFIELV